MALEVSATALCCQTTSSVDVLVYWPSVHPSGPHLLLPSSLSMWILAACASQSPCLYTLPPITVHKTGFRRACSWLLGFWVCKLLTSTSGFWPQLQPSPGWQSWNVALSSWLCLLEHYPWSWPMFGGSWNRQQVISQWPFHQDARPDGQGKPRSPEVEPKVHQVQVLEPVWRSAVGKPKERARHRQIEWGGSGGHSMQFCVKAVPSMFH